MPAGVTITAEDLGDAKAICGPCGRAAGLIGLRRMWGVRDGVTVTADPSGWCCEDCFTRAPAPHRRSR